MKTLVYKFTLLVIVLLVSQACRVYDQIHVGLRPDAVFFGKKYFAWLPEVSDTVNDGGYTKQIRERARQSIETELLKKGYVLSENSAAVYLKLQVANAKAEEIISLSPQNRPYARLFYGYLESTITLTAHESETADMLWACTARGRLYNFKQMNKGVKRAVKDMLLNYPVYMEVPFYLLLLEEELTGKIL